ncbi:MAG: aminotransferase [Deltaproteobacteria bacterium]|jgi:aspartate/methionine/tyrosine aminotransferase|nr:aminotransferase [Deltaproteobacteria bacterium]
MLIEKFGVERWMDLYETKCQFNLAETCVDSLTLEELLDLCGQKNILNDLLNMRLTYGDILGSKRLRGAVSKLYQTIETEHVLITHGAIGANHLVYETLIEPGDIVVAVHPTYQQHRSIPLCFGAEVRLLNLTSENNFLPDLEELESILTPGTKLLALNNPNNPAGSLMDRPLLERIVRIASDCGAYILCDEVYRGLDGAGDGFTVSVVDLYDKAISTGSMSKVYSLAGLRLGWLASRAPGLIEQVVNHRDYNTISVGMIDDYLAALALESRDKVLARSQAITRNNRNLLTSWVNNQPLIHWTPPISGTTALLKYDLDMPSWDLCVKLVEQTGVMLCPGSALGLEGWLRIGYACEAKVLAKGLALFSDFLAKSASSSSLLTRA